MARDNLYPCLIQFMQNGLAVPVFTLTIATFGQKSITLTPVPITLNVSRQTVHRPHGRRVI